MTSSALAEVAVIGIDIGKNTFHAIGLNQRGAIVLRQKWSRRQVADRLANLPPCLIGMEACVGGHHLARQCVALGHDARLMPAKYVKPYSKGQKNDFRDAEAIAEAVQRPTMRFEAEYIDARPKPERRNPLQHTAGPYIGSRAEIEASCWYPLHLRLPTNPRR